MRGGYYRTNIAENVRSASRESSAPSVANESTGVRVSATVP